MKRFLVSFLIVGILNGVAGAQCGYFRLSADLLKCAAVDMKTLNADNPYQPQDLPDVPAEAGSQALVQINCSCEYSLSGSNPICDMEQSLERSSVVGVENVSETCRRGKSLCKDVCPARLPE